MFEKDGQKLDIFVRIGLFFAWVAVFYKSVRNNSVSEYWAGC
jgi:hypothetical protein